VGPVRPYWFPRLRHFFIENFGGRTWARTKDPLIKSQLLYQLSYASISGRRWWRLEGAAAFGEGAN
jgi:hypothetical protein